jgi:hypothetical protein
MFASGTIAPWLIGALLLLLLLTTGITAKSWRELKCSPYFFLRRQAMHRMQSYSLVSFCLALVTVVTVAFTWQKPQDDTLRTALIAYAKPILDSEATLEQPAFTAEADEAEVVSPVFSLFELADTAVVHVDLTDGTLVTAETSPSLPAELRRVEPTAALKPDTSVSSITFATNISDRYQPLNPATKFDEGYFTLYATFRYDAMAEGMSWTWVWRHNGILIEGDNKLWQHEGNGPGYVYFRPANGFNPGRYTLEVWVNNELQDQATVTITEGISTGN